MSISAILFTATAAAAAIVLLTIARRSTPPLRPNRHVILDADTPNPDSTAGYRTQESLQAIVRVALHDQHAGSSRRIRS